MKSVESSEARVADRLRRESRRMTGPREAVVRLLREQSRPLSRKEIHQSLPPGCCDLATVYRCVGVMEGLGLVQRLVLGDGVVRYQFAERAGEGHRHHLICTRCTRMVEVRDCGVCEIEKRVASRNGFKAVTHRLEFFGLCPACQ